MSSSSPTKRKRTTRTPRKQDEPVERRKGKRERQDVEEEKRTMKMELREAKKELKEAEKKRDTAKAERNNYREAYLGEQDPDCRAVFKTSLDDAESDLKTAKAALNTAQSAVNTYQRALNRLIDPHSAESSSTPESPHSTGSSVGSRRTSKRARSGDNTVTEAPKSVQEFWVQLGDAKVGDNKKLQLVGDTRFLGSKKLQSELYIRDHYEKIFARILFLATEKELTGTAILGTPGIGKTCFLYWLLWKLRLLNVPVVIFEAGDEAYRFLANGTVSVTGDVRAYPELREKDCWYLADAVKPVFYCRGITVLSTSPDRNKWYQFEQQVDAVVLYMPLFTLEEMLECQKACFPDMEEKDVRARFDKYGGMARAVLQKPATGQPSMMDRYDTAIDELDDDYDVKVLRNVHSAIRKKDDVVHRIVHMDVTDLEEYTHFEYRIASRQIEEAILAKYWRGQADRVCRFVRAVKGHSLMAQIRGLAFEELAHSVLCQGGTFRVRSLETPGEVQQDTWERRELVRFDSLDQVQSIVDNGGYACPVDKTLPAVDAFAGRCALQMTVSLSHPIDGHKLDELLEVVDVERLVFVVPADQFEAFGRQDVGGKNAESLEQYVLEIPL